ncbi:hypothetical protein QTO34_004017 [Cnephaeus nilssonii]|uniref:Uncharacterized protein n=1 Tax=Cnephaeus nilssonii TaxID=3371016 RepID=A0AA40HRQ6_CNENI|nr:hypothetical protein QTO34_004017 [Eptesicus nilssonii]
MPRQVHKFVHWTPSILLKNLVSMARKASLRQFLSSEDNRCGLHKETKQIFCEDHRSLLFALFQLSGARGPKTLLRGRGC